MSSKLDTSLDDILKTRRQSKPRGRGGRRSDVARPAPTGPVGGVGKSTRPAKQSKPAASGSAPQETSGKILVSGLVSIRDAQRSCTSLTFLSPTMSIKPSSRYVRPLQVFEPTFASQLCDDREPNLRNDAVPKPFGTVCSATNCTKSRSARCLANTTSTRLAVREHSGVSRRRSLKHGVPIIRYKNERMDGVASATQLAQRKLAKQTLPESCTSPSGHGLRTLRSEAQRHIR
jgi:hypothetical protein